MRILITGRNGQLGRSIQNSIAGTKCVHDFTFVGREELDLSSKNSIDRYFEINNRFDIIVNCAAYTAVDKAEKEQDLANQINHLAVKQIAEIAVEQKSKLIHISTDYVFDGESSKPYIENDSTNPINVYGETKLAGEISIKDVMPINAIIIRTSWVYSEYGKNFVKSMLKLGEERDELNVVSDQIGSPTYASDLATTILLIINDNNYQNIEKPTEIYHYSNEGGVSWFDFAREIFKVAKVNCKARPIATAQYPTPAKRPKNTLMSKDKIVTAFGIDKIDWVYSLKKCLLHK